jgi:hypothetical protein
VIELYQVSDCEFDLTGGSPTLLRFYIFEKDWLFTFLIPLRRNGFIYSFFTSYSELKNEGSFGAVGGVDE